MKDSYERLSIKPSGFSIIRKNKAIQLTKGEATDCMIHCIDNMAHESILAACVEQGKVLTQEQMLVLQESITTGIIMEIGEKTKKIEFNLFQ